MGWLFGKKISIPEKTKQKIRSLEAALPDDDAFSSLRTIISKLKKGHKDEKTGKIIPYDPKAVKDIEGRYDYYRRKYSKQK